MTVVARAPGKAVLFGEYAVLEGAPALVAALTCTAEAYFTRHAASHWTLQAPQLGAQATLVAGAGLPAAPGTEVPTSLALAASLVRQAHAAKALPYGALRLDTRAFYRGGQKLGFGSSAAVAVAGWQALRGAGAADDALDTVMALHAAAQGGRGSGVDVAAATLGGVVRYQLGGLPGSQGLQHRSARRLTAPPCAQLVFVYTGHAVATGPYLAAFAALKADRPQVYWARLEPLAQLAAAACEVWALGHTAALLPLVEAATAALTQLGEALGLPIVDAAHAELAALARRCGGAYKPSGAGGGDVGVAFCPTPKVAAAVRQAVRAAGYVPLDVDVAGRGVTCHTGDEKRV